jgi:hypothetical protein
MAVYTEQDMFIEIDGKTTKVLFDLNSPTWQAAAEREFSTRPAPPVPGEVCEHWLENIRQHLRPDESLTRKTALYLPQDANKGVIIVGSGPSLEKNALLLQDPDVRERYTIVAINAAINFVIEPDYYVFTERNWSPDGWIRLRDWKVKALLTTPYSNYLTVPAIRPPLTYYVVEDYSTGVAPVASAAWSLMGFSPGLRLVPWIQETSNLALWAALWLRAPKVVLVGMDYCYETVDTYYAGNPVKPEFVPPERKRSFRQSYEAVDMNGRKVMMSPTQFTCLCRTKLILNTLRARGAVVINASGGGMITEAVDHILPLEEAL